MRSKFIPETSATDSNPQDQGMPRTSPVSDPFEEGATKKPPAFQFYVKDWRSSRTVQLMTPEDRGIYIDLLAASWDSDEPGTLTLPVVGYNPRTVRAFLIKWPSTFAPNGSESDPNLAPMESQRRLKEGRKQSEFGLKFTNSKLREQFENICRYKETKSLAGKKGNEIRWEESSHSDRSAFASAIASASASAIKEPSENIFSVFWHAYPKKVNEAAALRAWVHVTGIHNHIEEILGAIDRYVQSGMWDDPQMIPNAENFIRDKRWRDEIPKKVGTKHEQRINATLEAARRAMENGPEMGDSSRRALSDRNDGAGDSDILRRPTGILLRKN